MPVFSFYKFSPSGNTTLFLTGSPAKASGRYCRAALRAEGVCAEQCGWADIESRHLQMGGGEFCANACRAFGALLALTSPEPENEAVREYEMTVSGLKAPVRLLISGAPPLWRADALFSMPGAKVRKLDERRALAELPGITHLLLAADWPDISDIPALAQKHRSSLGLSGQPASGVVWWRRNKGGFQILPHVEVPSQGSSMIESSCGSAVIALALSLASDGGEIAALQPGGSVLRARLPADGRISLSGDVRLCARGEIFLPEL